MKTKIGANTKKAFDVLTKTFKLDERLIKIRGLAESHTQIIRIAGLNEYWKTTIDNWVNANHNWLQQPQYIFRKEETRNGVLLLYIDNQKQ